MKAASGIVILLVSQSECFIASYDRHCGPHTACVGLGMERIKEGTCSAIDAFSTLVT